MAPGDSAHQPQALAESEVGFASESDDAPLLAAEHRNDGGSRRREGGQELLAVLNWWDGVGVSVGVVVGKPAPPPPV